MKGIETWFNGRLSETQKGLAWLAPAMLMALLAGADDVQKDSLTAESAEIAEKNRPGNGKNSFFVFSASSASSAVNPAVSSNQADPSSAPSAFSAVNQAVAGLDVKFKDAIEHFRQKRTVSPEAFSTLERAAKSRAFSAAGFANDYARDKVRDSLQKAIEEGRTADAWLHGLQDDFKSLGLGEAGDAHYLRLVFRQNVYGAYNAGRYAQMKRVVRERPYWQYLTVGDDRVRPEHAALHGVIRRADDPFWRKYYPPNAFGCRCMVVSVSAEELRAEGLEEIPDEEIGARYQELGGAFAGLPPIPEGFDVDPAEAFGGLEELTA